MANIKDVALHAGVSVTTVSHVVNGTRFVSEVARQRVEAAVRDTVLKLRGINTLQEFMMRQRQAMDETRVDRSSHNIQGEI